MVIALSRTPTLVSRASSSSMGSYFLNIPIYGVFSKIWISYERITCACSDCQGMGLTSTHHASGGPAARSQRKGGWRGHLALRQGTASPAPLLDEWISDVQS